MNKLKNKYPNADIFIISSLLLLVFWMFCTKMIIKMDDGHFMGILANNNFSLAEWLRLRYETLSGRTVAEAMMMTFLNAPHILWKLFGFALFEYIIYFIYKISLAFNKQAENRHLAVMSCCSVFLIFIGVLNAGAFWFAGSFTFLVPCTFMLITISPAVFDFLGIDYHFIHKIIAVPCAVVASSQEQASVCTCSFLVCLFIFSAFKKKLHITSFTPFIPAVAGTVYLLTSPGVANRGTQQASDSFEAFTQFGLTQKLLLGFTNYCSYTFFISIIITLLFTILLCAVLFEFYKDNKRIKKLTYIIFAAVVFAALIYNIIHRAAAKSSVDANIQKAFTNNEINIWVYLTAAVCGLVIVLWAVAVFLILKKNFSAGITVGLLCCAAIGCGLMMGFSSSIFASGKRVFFYSELLMIIACTVLYSNLRPSKFSKIILRVSSAAALIFYVFDVFNMCFIEIPIMN